MHNHGLALQKRRCTNPVGFAWSGINVLTSRFAAKWAEKQLIL